MQVTGQHHSPADLPPVKTQVPVENEGYVGTSADLDAELEVLEKGTDIRGGIQNIPDSFRHLYSSCGSKNNLSQQAKL
jgi:hypothetical protein